MFVKEIPRVAYFPDSFLEVNGVAMTSKRLIGYAKRNGYPFLCIYAGKKTGSHAEGNITYLSLKRSPVAFKMDEDLAYDPLFQRHVNRVLPGCDPYHRPQRREHCRSIPRLETAASAFGLLAHKHP